MLPYQNLEEAAVSLGRNLTFAETIWFNYSYQKPDYILYYHNILFMFIVYTLVPLPFAAAKLTMKLDKFKIQPRIDTSFSDMLACFKRVMVTYLLAVAPSQIFSCPIIQRIGIRTSLPLPSGWEIFAHIFVYFLIEDYVNYWLHRCLHTKWGYEKIHRIHHEYKAPTAFVGPYAHGLEIVFLGSATLLGPWIVPGHIITFWLWMVLMQMEAIETHSGYDFPWSPSKYIPFYGGAEFHDYHHFVGGKSRGNFGSVFTYCDYIYGTDKGYRYRKEVLKKDIGKYPKYSD